MTIPLLTTLCLSLAAQDPHREFDFWVGEWSVQNRHIQPDGSWKDGDVTRARIVPVCGDRAILEEWAGPFRGAFMNGFSLRAWDPHEERWALLLFWTVDGNSSFGRLHGSFRHGRGEFFAGGGSNLTRYSFSDALPDTVRWDSATTTDAGITWKTDWIMEFSRTRTAAEVTQDVLFAEPWTEGQLSPHAEARRLDWMIGTWSGTQTDADGDELEARLRCKLLNKDCLVLDLLETRPAGSADWDERLCVRGFSAGTGAWEGWRVAERDTVLRKFEVTPDGDVFVFEHTDPRTGSKTREFLVRIDDSTMQIEVITDAGTDAEQAVTTLLERQG